MEVHQEISRCVTQSECAWLGGGGARRRYAVTLQSEGGEPVKVNGKVHVEAPANGVAHMEERVPVSIHEALVAWSGGAASQVPATWMEAMPRGRSQSPTAVKPGPLACDVQFAQPYQSGAGSSFLPSLRPHDTAREPELS